MAEKISRAWKKHAQSICQGVIHINPLNGVLTDKVNVALSALKGLAILKSCPVEYAEQAAKIRLDGVWGPTAEKTHMLLGELSSDDGQASEYYQ